MAGPWDEQTDAEKIVNNIREELTKPTHVFKPGIPFIHSNITSVVYLAGLWLLVFPGISAFPLLLYWIILVLMIWSTCSHVAKVVVGMLLFIPAFRKWIFNGRTD